MKKTFKKIMRNRFALILILVMIGLCVRGVTTEAAGSSNISTVKYTVSHKQTEARKMLAMINRDRTGGKAWYYQINGSRKYLGKMRALKYDYRLEKIAMKRAEEISLRFNHFRPNGKPWYSLRVNSTYSFGENLAAGNSTAKATYAQWLETEKGYGGQGHRRLMFYNGYTSIGIACVKVGGISFWVQEFGFTNSGAKKTVANNELGIAKIDYTTKLIDKKSKSGKGIHIKDGWGYSYRYNLEGVVKKITLSGVSSVKVGKTITLKAKVTAEKGANKKLKWTTSNKKYATVSSKGVVKGLKAGKGKAVTITAKSTDGSGKKAMKKIRIQ